LAFFAVFGAFIISTCRQQAPSVRGVHTDCTSRFPTNITYKSGEAAKAVRDPLGPRWPRSPVRHEVVRDLHGVDLGEPALSARGVREGFCESLCT
jgi:hypothetical protein